MVPGILRKCPTCGEQYVHKTRLKCAACAKAYNATWYAKNRDRVAARVKAYRAANIERYRVRDASWSAANPDQVKAKSRAWYKANRERSIEKSKQWQRKNPEKVKARNAENWQKNREDNMARRRSWGAVHPEKDRAWRRAWEERNPERVRIQKSNYKRRKRGGKLSPGLIEKLMKLQRGMCACCGKPLGDDYHLDHRVPLARGGGHQDSNMQLLRSLCNMQKNKKDPIEFMQSRGFLI